MKKENEHLQCLDKLFANGVDSDKNDHRGVPFTIIYLLPIKSFFVAFGWGKAYWGLILRCYASFNLHIFNVKTEDAELARENI